MIDRDFMRKWIFIALLAFLAFSYILFGEDYWFGALVISIPIFILLLRKKRTVPEMSGHEYEDWCARQLVRKKHFRSATVTQATGDFGADIIAVDRKGRKWVFQCKHYQKKVGNSAVQEAVAAKAHYDADMAGVITNSCLTRKARELAEENEVELLEWFSD